MRRLWVQFLLEALRNRIDQPLYVYKETGSTSQTCSPRLVCGVRFHIEKEWVNAMSNQNWEDDDFDFDLDEETQQRSATGNDLVKQLRKAQRQAEKRAKELETELQSLRSVQRENVIKSVLEQKGLNPKVAKFIPGDIEPTADALTQWFEENGDIFGVPSTQQNDNAEDLNAMRQIDAVTATAVTPDKLDNLMLRIDQANSSEELLNMIFGSNQ